jgi:hypothetical protein
VICDQEKIYAEAFAAYLMKNRDLAFQVWVCDGITQLYEMQKEHSIDILVVDGRYTKEERDKIQAAHIFVLVESGKTRRKSNKNDSGNDHESDHGKNYGKSCGNDYEKNCGNDYGKNHGNDYGKSCGNTDRTDGESDREEVLYRYQSAEALLAQIISGCSRESGAEEMFLQRGSTQMVRMLGMYSPVHRCGKTGYALKLGKELAESENVLYLSLESYGGIGGYFPEEGQTIVDALYYSRQEGQNLGMILPLMIRHMDKLDYLLPARVSEDIKSVTYEDWKRLFRQIAEQSIYEVLILDMDETVDGIYEILRSCEEIHVMTVKDEMAAAKIRQFEEELQLLGYDDVRHRLIKKEQML